MGSEKVAPPVGFADVAAGSEKGLDEVVGIGLFVVAVGRENSLDVVGREKVGFPTAGTENGAIGVTTAPFKKESEDIRLRSKTPKTTMKKNIMKKIVRWR